MNALSVPSANSIVQRVWNYCNVLRDDGMSYGDYVEQLTYLLFLKMADESTNLLGKVNVIPDEVSWQSLSLAMGTNSKSITGISSPALVRAPVYPNDLPQGAEQDSRPRKTAPLDRAHQRRDLDWP